MFIFVNADIIETLTKFRQIKFLVGLRCGILVTKMILSTFGIFAWLFSFFRAMHELLELNVRNIILTSGTLYPITSLQAELGL